MQTEWFTPALPWEAFWMYALLLGCAYAALKFAQRRLAAGGIYLEDADHAVRSALRVTLIVLDPLIVLTVIALFVAVWPTVHGIIVGLVLIFGFAAVRDYVAGYVVRFDHNARVGKHLIHSDAHGVVNGFGLTGLYLQQEEGRTRIAYHRLLREGYTVATDPGVPAYYHLLVTVPGVPELPDEPESDRPATLPPHGGGPQRRGPFRVRDDRATALDASTRRLRNRLVESPYVRRGFTIAPHAGDTLGNLLDLDVGLHRGDHVRHLIRQLREAGFDASLVNR